jgi:hypothetical protein
MVRDFDAGAAQGTVLCGQRPGGGCGGGESGADGAVADEGYSADQVAVLAGVGRPTVNTWVRRYAQAGLDGLVDRPKPGKPAQVSGQYSASYKRSSRAWPTHARPAEPFSPNGNPVTDLDHDKALLEQDGRGYLRAGRAGRGSGLAGRDRRVGEGGLAGPRGRRGHAGRCLGAVAYPAPAPSQVTVCRGWPSGCRWSQG